MRTGGFSGCHRGSTDTRGAMGFVRRGEASARNKDIRKIPDNEGARGDRIRLWRILFVWMHADTPIGRMNVDWPASQRNWIRLRTALQHIGRSDLVIPEDSS